MWQFFILTKFGDFREATVIFHLSFLWGVAWSPSFLSEPQNMASPPYELQASADPLHCQRQSISDNWRRALFTSDLVNTVLSAGICSSSVDVCAQVALIRTIRGVKIWCTLTFIQHHNSCSRHLFCVSRRLWVSSSVSQQKKSTTGMKMKQEETGRLKHGYRPACTERWSILTRSSSKV